MLAVNDPNRSKYTLEFRIPAKTAPCWLPHAFSDDFPTIMKKFNYHDTLGKTKYRVVDADGQEIIS